MDTITLLRITMILLKLITFLSPCCCLYSDPTAYSECRWYSAWTLVAGIALCAVLYAWWLPYSYCGGDEGRGDRQSSRHERRSRQVTAPSGNRMVLAVSREGESADDWSRVAPKTPTGTKSTLQSDVSESIDTGLSNRLDTSSSAVGRESTSGKNGHAVLLASVAPIASSYGADRVVEEDAEEFYPCQERGREVGWSEDVYNPLQPAAGAEAASDPPSQQHSAEQH